MPEVTAGCTGVLISQFSKIFLPKLPTFTLSTLILNELRISLSHLVGLHLWYERYMHPQQGGGFSEHQSQSGALQPCRKTFLYSFKAQNILKISFSLKKTHHSFVLKTRKTMISGRPWFDVK